MLRTGDATTRLGSPVPWIADEVWSAWNQRPASTADACAIEEPLVVAATDDDRRRAPVFAQRDHATDVPAVPGVDEATRLLATSPASAYRIHSPVWPLCCERVATLINHQGTGISLQAIERRTGPLDRAFLETELRQGWGATTPAAIADVLGVGFRDVLAVLRERGAVDGVALFHCAACGRVYVASCHP